MTARLDGSERAAALRTLSGWTLSPNGSAIRKSFRFGNFSQAFSFMTRVALEAEKLDHHPDWTNSYNLVEIGLTTHAQGGLTELDFVLAARIDAIQP